MTKHIKHISMVSLSALMLASTTSLANAQSHTGQVLRIENTIGQIELITGDYDRITVKGAGALKLGHIRNETRIDGGEYAERTRCKTDNGRIEIGTRKTTGLSFFGLGKHDMKPLSAYPDLKVTAPEGTKIIIEESLLIGNIGDIGAAEIEMASCGDLTIASIGGKFDLDLSGSGDIALGTTATADIDVSGAGDLNIEEITGFAEIESSGAGEIAIGRIGGGLRYEGSGASDINIEYVKGNLDIESSGSGDVIIKNGDVGTLSISASGASDVSYGGTARSASAHASGAADISIPRPAGHLETSDSGAGDVEIRE